MPVRLSRASYAQMFGPTIGDRIRLADTDLFVEVEKDFTVYGEEVKFGGGKVIRDGMGQSQKTRAEGGVDTVITNALIIDAGGIYKADVGLRDGRIAGIGKAGNPDVMAGVSPNMVVAATTEAIAGEGFILTAAGDVELNKGASVLVLKVANSGDRPVQVGSHYHFYETNPALIFDRDSALGRRLDIPAGTAVRFEPGQTRQVTLIPIAGARRIFGFRQTVMGDL